MIKMVAIHSVLCKLHAGILLLDTLEPALGDFVPVARIRLALLKEVHEQRRRLVALVRVNVEARHAVHDDLSRTTIGGGERGQATGHGLNHRQPERLVESRLCAQTGTTVRTNDFATKT